MPSFQYPPSAGGGGGGGGLPVTGGSGVQYASIAIAQASEAEIVTVDTTQAGTAPGTIVGSAALPAVDGALVDRWVVLTDPTPGNGLACRYARISVYVGATRTMTLDQPWDFGVGETYEIISPIRLALNQDLTEDAAFVKNVELDLGGHRLKGKIDQTVGSFCWIRGGGYVTNGVQKTNIGVLRISDVSVSRRDGTIYAVLMTDGSNLGRTVLENCHFFGVVAGRRGRAGWEIDDCRNDGIAETNRNIPYRFFESVAGVAIVVTQADWAVEGEWSGAVFYSENSLTGGAAFVEGQINAKVPKLLTATVTSEQPVFAYLFCGVGAATLTMTWVANGKSTMTVAGNDFVAGVGAIVPDGNVGLCGFGLFIDFTGVFSASLGGGGTVNRPVSFVGVGSHLAGIHVRGTVTMSGSITTSSGAMYYSAPSFNCARVLLESSISGTITDGCEFLVHNVRRCIQIVNTAVQGNASTVLLTARMIAQDIFAYTTFDMIGATSAGTWTVSGQIEIHSLASLQTVNAGGSSLGFASLLGAVSGGTFTVSGLIGIAMSSGNVITADSFDIASHIGTGGTLTISGIFRIVGGICEEIRAINVTGTGTATISSAVTIVGFKLHSGVATNFVRSATATATAVLSGAVVFENCFWDGIFTFINLLAGAITGPSSVTFEDCVFRAALTTESVTAGVLTWVASTWRFRNCHVEGLFTFVGTRFTTMEAFETFFNANVSDESITATGTRPATYRLWKCGYVARVEDLQPEIMHDWEVRPASGALVAGQLLTINAAGQATSPVAGNVVEGILLIAVAALADAAIMVRRGVIFVDSNAVVVAGDNCNLNAAIPTEQITGAFAAGSRTGRALEATGAVRAGEAYTVVNLG